jgi:hypothetical protein
LKIGFSWFETDHPDFLVTEGRRNLDSSGNALLTILFFKALRIGQPLNKIFKK